MAIKNKAGFVCPPPVPMTIKSEHVQANWMRWEFLAYCANRFGWTKGAELGLWQGRTTTHLLEHCPKLTMIGVDLWAAQPENDGPEDYAGWDHGQHERQCRDSLAPYADRVTIIKAMTSDATTWVEDASLDFVFIDADHSESGVRSDIAAWLPKIKPTGWIMGHDISWDGVRSAVGDLVPGFEIGPDVTWFCPVNQTDGWSDLL